jgi:energy-coupling factor transporter ATP-binding protein EcfA2
VLASRGVQNWWQFRQVSGAFRRALQKGLPADPLKQLLPLYPSPVQRAVNQFIHNPAQPALMLMGPPGTGKSRLLNAIAQQLPRHTHLRLSGEPQVREWLTQAYRGDAMARQWVRRVLPNQPLLLSSNEWDLVEAELEPLLLAAMGNPPQGLPPVRLLATSNNFSGLSAQALNRLGAQAWVFVDHLSDAGLAKVAQQMALPLQPLSKWSGVSTRQLSSRPADPLLDVSELAGSLRRHTLAWLVRQQGLPPAAADRLQRACWPFMEQTADNLAQSARLSPRQVKRHFPLVMAHLAQTGELKHLLPAKTETDIKNLMKAVVDAYQTLLPSL